MLNCNYINSVNISNDNIITLWVIRVIPPKIEDFSILRDDSSNKPVVFYTTPLIGIPCEEKVSQMHIEELNRWDRHRRRVRSHERAFDPL